MAGLGGTATAEVPLHVEADPQALVDPVAPVPPKGTVVATTSQMGASTAFFKGSCLLISDLVVSMVALTPETTCMFLV